MAKLAETLPEGVFAPYSAKAKTIQYITNNTKDRELSVIEQGGKLFQVQGEYLAPLEEVVSYKLKDAKRTAEREKQIRDLWNMRRLYGALIDAERDGLQLEAAGVLLGQSNSGGSPASVAIGWARKTGW